MTKYSFANLDAWVLKSERRIDAILKSSAQDVVKIAQEPKAKGGRMPVDTGFLRNSLVSSVVGGMALGGAASYVMVAASLRGGDVANFGWTAEYAGFVNSGANGRPGDYFLEGAADQWPLIVAGNTVKAKAAVR